MNGSGIALDAAGRGLKVMLCEMDDLASATSSSSSKLIHGGLRYLEHYEFRLVREALAEREVLLAKVAGAAKASMSKAAALFQAPLSKTVRTAEALRAKLDEQGENAA